MGSTIWVVVLIIYELLLNGVLPFFQGIKENRQLRYPEKYENYIAPLGKPLPNRLHLRVAQISKVAIHPNDNSIYVLDILISLEPIKRRRAISSLAKYYHPFDLVGSSVIIAVNMKLTMYLDIAIEVALLCATSDSKNPRKVELLEAPEPVTLGERAFFEKHQYGRPDPDILNSTRHLWKILQGGMSITSRGKVHWEGYELRTLRGVVKTQNITNGYIRLCHLLNY